MLTVAGQITTLELYYNARDLLLETVIWSAEEIRNTSTYTRLDQGGANYINADQVRDLVLEVAQKKNVYAFGDPGIETKLRAKVQEIFNSFIHLATEEAVKSRDDMVTRNAEVLAGTGLDPKRYHFSIDVGHDRIH